MSIRLQNLAVAALPTAVFILLAALALFDAKFAHRRWGPIGQHVVRFTRRYPTYYFLLALLFGALIGHFFLKWSL
jgi:hypothetical protein